MMRMMTPRQKNRTVLLATLGLVALNLTACNDANWIAELAKEAGNKGGPSSGATGGAKGNATGGAKGGATGGGSGGASGGTSAMGGAASCTPGSGGTGGQPACRSDVFGGDGVCFDVGTLKQNAYFACDKAGLTLGDYVPYDQCGTDSYLFTKYTCCPKVIPVDPVPPPPAPQCETKSQGSEVSCKGADVWRQYASDDCAATGGKMNAYSPYGECGSGGFRYVKYACCGQTTPPPPPPSPTLQCETKSQGSETSCKGADVWRQYASDDCAATGTTLSNYSPYNDCGIGGFRNVQYTCCGQPTTPPPAQECSTASQGGDTSCKPGYVWKQYATDACAAAAASPTEISPYDDCGDGNFRSVKYTCCRNKESTPVPAPKK